MEIAAVEGGVAERMRDGWIRTAIEERDVPIVRYEQNPPLAVDSRGQVVKNSIVAPDDVQLGLAKVSALALPNDPTMLKGPTASLGLDHTVEQTVGWLRFEVEVRVELQIHRVRVR